MTDSLNSNRRLKSLSLNHRYFDFPTHPRKSTSWPHFHRRSAQAEIEYKDGEIAKWEDEDTRSSRGSGRRVAAASVAATSLSPEGERASDHGELRRLAAAAAARVVAPAVAAWARRFQAALHAFEADAQAGEATEEATAAAAPTPAAACSAVEAAALAVSARCVRSMLEARRHETARAAAEEAAQTSRGAYERLEAAFRDLEVSARDRGAAALS
jgi:hypothetical protein